ncbi:MAG: VapC toxin family PIN domain ribonuclease [Pyrinomonadaceae bacterium]
MLGNTLWKTHTIRHRRDISSSDPDDSENARNDGTRLVTTNYVIAELVALFTSPFHISRPRIIEYIDGIKQSPSVDLIHIDHGLGNQAWKLLTERDDKNWSLVDCSSFVVMQDEGITESLTTDHHLEQGGFVRLLK